MKTYNFKMHNRNKMRFGEGSFESVTAGVLAPPATMELDTNEYLIVVNTPIEDVGSELIRIEGHKAFIEFQELITKDTVTYSDLGISGAEELEAKAYAQAISSAIKKSSNSLVHCNDEGSIFSSSFFDEKAFDSKTSEEVEESLELYGARINGVSYQFLKSGRPEMGTELVGLLKDQVSSLADQLMLNGILKKLEEPEAKVEEAPKPKEPDYGETFSLF